MVATEGFTIEQKNNLDEFQTSTPFSGGCYFEPAIYNLDLEVVSNLNPLFVGAATPALKHNIRSIRFVSNLNLLFWGLQCHEAHALEYRSCRFNPQPPFLGAATIVCISP